MYLCTFSPSNSHREKIRGKHPKRYIYNIPLSTSIFLSPFFPIPSYLEGAERGRGRVPREAIKWHFPVANINLFAVDRANIRSVGQWRERICGLRPWEYYGFKVSRGPRSNPRHQRGNISIFRYRINGPLAGSRRGHKSSADPSYITGRRRERFQSRAGVAGAFFRESVNDPPPIQLIRPARIMNGRWVRCSHTNKCRKLYVDRIRTKNLGIWNDGEWYKVTYLERLFVDQFVFLFLKKCRKILYVGRDSGNIWEIVKKSRKVI